MISKYSFSGKIWKFRGHAGWHFVTLPKVLCRKIRARYGRAEEGWGRLKATAILGRSKWETAIWYDTKSEAYLLPIKSTIRAKEKIAAESRVRVQLLLDAPPKRTKFAQWA